MNVIMLYLVHHYNLGVGQMHAETVDCRFFRYVFLYSRSFYNIISLYTDHERRFTHIKVSGLKR